MVSIKGVTQRITPKFVKKKLLQKQLKNMYDKWKLEGAVVPPPHAIKQYTISTYQSKRLYSTFIETGTFRGHMVEAQIPFFKNIISIELSEELFLKVKAKFSSFENIKLLQGDSGKVLHQVVPTLEKPSLFWLDGHYSGGKTAKGEKECPIYEELDAIFKSNLKHTILIDDARLFIGENDYPTLIELNDFIQKSGRGEEYTLSSKDDIIRITPLHR